MAFDIKKFIARFVEEARDHVTKLNDGLIALENSPGDLETIHAIFRSAHTIKGSSRMLKLTAITELAHTLEDVFGAMRDGKIAHSKELADLLFRGIDAISDMIEKTAAGQEITAGCDDLCRELAQTAGGACVDALETPAPPSAPGKKETPDGPAGPGRTAAGTKPPREQTTERTDARRRTSDTVRISSAKLDDLVTLMGEIVSNQYRIKQRMQDVKATERSVKACVEHIRKAKAQDDGAVPATLLDLAETLQAQVRQLSADMKDDHAIQELLIGELQEKALIMRMVPLSIVFDSLQRMVRDIARSLGKEVDLAIEGGEIELDKIMVEKIGEPLVHMIRNAIDHGIESPEDRHKAGKLARASVKISAFYDAGNVVIELGDDGRGIPLDGLKQKALKKKLFTEEELDAMEEAELVNLIFQPGLSTSAIITDLSGRGVGMDVVRKNIVEDLKGAITVKTTAGTCTVFTLRLPLTLAIMPMLLVTAAGDDFAIATSYVREIIRIPRSEFMNVVDKTAIRLRNEFVPVADLALLLKLPAHNGGISPAADREPLIIIVRSGAEHLGLVVDGLVDEHDMAVKLLPVHMRHIRVVSGVTLSGRNDVVPILHIPALFDAAREMRQTRVQAEQDEGEQAAVNILVVDDSINTREIEKSILESYGYRVTLAEDGRDGLEKAKGFPFDAVITDVEMPQLDGFTLTGLLRKEESYRHKPIIIVTSREKEEDKRRGIQVGADAYIVKGSFDQSILLDTVHNLIG